MDCAPSSSPGRIWQCKSINPCSIRCKSTSTPLFSFVQSQCLPKSKLYHKNRISEMESAIRNIIAQNVHMQQKPREGSICLIARFVSLLFFEHYYVEPSHSPSIPITARTVAKIIFQSTRKLRSRIYLRSSSSHSSKLRSLRCG